MSVKAAKEEQILIKVLAPLLVESAMNIDTSVSAKAVFPEPSTCRTPIVISYSVPVFITTVFDLASLSS